MKEGRKEGGEGRKERTEKKGGGKCSADDEGSEVEGGRKENRRKGMKDRKEGKKVKKGSRAWTMNEGE